MIHFVSILYNTRLTGQLRGVQLHEVTSILLPPIPLLPRPLSYQPPNHCHQLLTNVHDGQTDFTDHRDILSQLLYYTENKPYLSA